MEFINKIQLRGYVGSVKDTAMQDARVFRFSLVTEQVYRSVNGAVVECTWSQIAYWAKEGETLDWLKKNAPVEVEGHLRQYRYTGQDGNQYSAVEIMASSVKQVTED